MMEFYRNLSIPTTPPRREIDTFSMTADVQSFRRCKRQYRLLRELNFKPPNPTQLYFGTVIHQTLDLAHAHYKGLIDEAPRGSIPTRGELYSYFRRVENGLFARGVTPFQKGPQGGFRADSIAGDEEYYEVANYIGFERASAFIRLRIFNEMFGEMLYPSVINTECRLDINNEDFIITGNVDVIKRDDSGGIELWDYKSFNSSTFIGKDPMALDAEMQMRIYAKLYQNRAGQMPSKAIIVCIGDIDPLSPADSQRLDDMLFEVPGINDELEQERALDEFTRTVREIQNARSTGQWGYPETDPGDKTCNGCPSRWECDTERFGRSYPRRYP